MTRWERFMLMTVFGIEIGRLFGMAAAQYNWW